MANKIKLTLVKSGIGYSQKQRATLTGLGLRKLHHSSVLENTACVRGMVRKVQHLVTIEAVSE